MSVREGVSGAPTLTEAPSGCSNAVCGVVESTEPVVAGKKTTHRLTVNVGEEALLSVQSKAEVEVGSRIVVAMAGSSIGDAVISEPKICDADTLGWQGPSNGPSSTAPSASGLSTGPVLLPKTFAPGDSVPDERPKVGRAAAAVDKMGNAEGAAEAVEVRSIESCSMPTPVAQLYLWHSYTCGTATPVAQLYLWHSYTCGTATPVAQLPLWHSYTCGTAVPGACLYLWHGLVPCAVMHPFPTKPAYFLWRRLLWLYSPWQALFVTKPKLSKDEKEIAKLEKLVAKGDAKAEQHVQSALF
jgi:hypothetical protein